MTEETRLITVKNIPEIFRPRDRKLIESIFENVISSQSYDDGNTNNELHLFGPYLTNPRFRRIYLMGIFRGLDQEGDAQYVRDRFDNLFLLSRSGFPMDYGVGADGQDLENIIPICFASNKTSIFFKPSKVHLYLMTQGEFDSKLKDRYVLRGK